MGGRAGLVLRSWPLSDHVEVEQAWPHGCRYQTCFPATAGAAGNLIGLLFVAVSLRPQSIWGDPERAGSPEELNRQRVLSQRVRDGDREQVSSAVDPDAQVRPGVGAGQHPIGAEEGRHRDS